MKKALIVGYGFVGKATEYFLTKYCSLQPEIYDPYLNMTHLENEEWDFVFLCVPTNPKDGRLDVSILHEVYGKFAGEQIIRSTIGPDQVDEFENPTMWPEFLREANWKDDVDNPQVNPIVGGGGEFGYWLQFHALQDRMDVTRVEPKVASAFKLTRNAFLAAKVEFANITYDTVSKCGVKYNAIKQLLKLDKAIGGSHWEVPGPDGKRGFGGKCFPKDLSHFHSIVESPVTDTILSENKKRR